MEHRVDRVAGVERQHLRKVVHERRRTGIELEQVVQRLCTSVHPEPVTERPHQPSRDGVPLQIEHFPCVAGIEQATQPVQVTRKLPVVALVQPAHGVERGGVHLVDRSTDRGKATGEEHLAQAVRRDTEIVQ